VVVVASWDIDPAGVQHVLQQVASAAKPLDEAFKTFSSGVDSAVSGTGVGACTATNPTGQTGSPIVQAALAKWAESAADQGKAIVARIEAAGGGAADATRQYLAGDTEMAATAQRQAAAGTFQAVTTDLRTRR
jgi:hypothetical protein